MWKEIRNHYDFFSSFFFVFSFSWILRLILSWFLIGSETSLSSSLSVCRLLCHNFLKWRAKFHFPATISEHLFLRIPNTVWMRPQSWDYLWKDAFYTWDTVTLNQSLELPFPGNIKWVIITSSQLFLEKIEDYDYKLVGEQESKRCCHIRQCCKCVGTDIECEWGCFGGWWERTINLWRPIIRISII